MSGWKSAIFMLAFVHPERARILPCLLTFGDAAATDRLTPSRQETSPMKRRTFLRTSVLGTGAVAFSGT
ncbi:hypothetical protein, partial [Actinomadura sp. KC216]|uniref:hypothetical protein n=1 Tax=Actinomadura sp. KC216 TaxID=2530370 RepID=UPI001A9D5267